MTNLIGIIAEPVVKRLGDWTDFCGLKWEISFNFLAASDIKSDTTMAVTFIRMPFRFLIVLVLIHSLH